jgi:hypothetical protein
MATTETARDGHEGDGPPFLFEVDGVTYDWPQPDITGAQIMETAGIPLSTGIVLIHDDGTQETIAPDRIVELRPGKRIKKRPRFKRG